MILAIRTDKPIAEIILLDDEKEIARHEWEAHRQLATTLVGKIQTFLSDNNTSTDELKGIIVFSGSGSFTGLRIGATVANAIAYSHNIAVVSGESESWIESGLERLKTAKSGKYIIPTYDREPNITKPKN